MSRIQEFEHNAEVRTTSLIGKTGTGLKYAFKAAAFGVIPAVGVFTCADMAIDWYSNKYFPSLDFKENAKDARDALTAIGGAAYYACIHLGAKAHPQFEQQFEQQKTSKKEQKAAAKQAKNDQIAELNRQHKEQVKAVRSGNQLG